MKVKVVNIGLCAVVLSIIFSSFIFSQELSTKNKSEVVGFRNIPWGTNEDSIRFKYMIGKGFKSIDKYTICCDDEMGGVGVNLYLTFFKDHLCKVCVVPKGPPRGFSSTYETLKKISGEGKSKEISVKTPSSETLEIFDRYRRSLELKYGKPKQIVGQRGDRLLNKEWEFLDDGREKKYEVIWDIEGTKIILRITDAPKISIIYLAKEYIPMLNQYYEIEEIKDLEKF